MRRGSLRWMWVAGALTVVSAYPGWPQGDELPFEVPKYPIPEDNAWDYMIEAARVLKETEGSSGQRLITQAEQEGVTPDYTEVVKSYLPALEVLREGLYLPCRVPDPAPSDVTARDVARDEQFRMLAAIREFARALSYEAQAHVQQGERDAAVDSVQDGLRLGRNVTINGMVVHQLVASAISAISVNSLDMVLSACRPSAERLVKFANWNEQNRAEMQSLAGTLALEAKLKLEMMRQVTPEQYAAYMAKVIEWAGQPAHIRGPTPEAPWEEGYFDVRGAAIWARNTEKKLMNDASLAGMSIRCALEAYRERERRGPRTLGALSPDYLAEVPVDPCSGRDFVYVLRRLDGTGGYELYSVGPDGDDDGGRLVWSRADRDGDLLIAPEWKIYSSRGEPSREMRAMPPAEGVPGEVAPPAAEEPAPPPQEAR